MLDEKNIQMIIQKSEVRFQNSSLICEIQTHLNQFINVKGAHRL